MIKTINRRRGLNLRPHKIKQSYSHEPQEHKNQATVCQRTIKEKQAKDNQVKSLYTR